MGEDNNVSHKANINKEFKIILKIEILKAKVQLKQTKTFT